MKRILLSEDQSILFEFYDDLKIDLELVKVEVFYENKIIGSININEKISNLKNSWSGDKIISKECKLKEDFFRIMGEEAEKRWIATGEWKYYSKAGKLQKIETYVDGKIEKVEKFK